jgi:hypothetical protein
MLLGTFQTDSRRRVIPASRVLRCKVLLPGQSQQQQSQMQQRMLVVVVNPAIRAVRCEVLLLGQPAAESGAAAEACCAGFHSAAAAHGAERVVMQSLSLCSVGARRPDQLLVVGFCVDWGGVYRAFLSEMQAFCTGDAAAVCIPLQHGPRLSRWRGAERFFSCRCKDRQHAQSLLKPRHWQRMRSQLCA